MTSSVWLSGRFCLSLGTLRGPGKAPNTRGMRYCGFRFEVVGFHAGFCSLRGELAASPRGR